MLSLSGFLSYFFLCCLLCSSVGGLESKYSHKLLTCECSRPNFYLNLKNIMLYWFLHEQIICFYSWITWCITLIVLQLKYALSVHLIMTVVQLDGYASSCSPLPCLMSWNLEFCQIDQRWTAKSVCTLVMSVPVIIGNPIWSCYSRTPFLYGVVETGKQPLN